MYLTRDRVFIPTGSAPNQQLANLQPANPQLSDRRLATMVIRLALIRLRQCDHLIVAVQRADERDAVGLAAR
jgi:hypothetical protein